MHAQPFIWETHGIHVGTGADHVKHGIDDLDAVVERAIRLGFPSLTFIIHTPRLTRFRYASERATDGEVHPRRRLLFRFRRPDEGPARKVCRPDPGPLRGGAGMAGDRTGHAVEPGEAVPGTRCGLCRILGPFRPEWHPVRRLCRGHAPADRGAGRRGAFLGGLFRRAASRWWTRAGR